MGVKMRVRGLDQLRSNAKASATAIRRGSERAVRDEVDALADDMRAHAPVGDASRGTRGEPPLAESIVATADGLTGSAGATAKHGIWVEHGSKSHTAQPFALPASERSRRRFPRRVADEVDRELR